MFKKLEFHYDFEGRYTGEYKGGHYEEKPLVIRAEDCNAAYFYVESGTVMGRRDTVPSLQIVRALGPLKKDPYHETGHPPALMTIIAIPHLQFLGDVLIVEGLEMPNLCWAGLLAQPYTDGYKRLPGVHYMHAELDKRSCRHRFEELTRQRIELK